MHFLFVQDEPHDKAFQAWLKENRTIACPTCGQGLQKQEGCNHLQYVPSFSQAVYSVLRMGFCLSSCAHWPQLCCQQFCAHLPFACCPLLPVCWSVCSVLHAPCAFSCPPPRPPCRLPCPPHQPCHLLCHSHMPCTLFIYSPLPFLACPSCGLFTLVFCHLQDTFCPKSAFLFGKSASCCVPSTPTMHCLLPFETCLRSAFSHWMQVH